MRCPPYNKSTSSNLESCNRVLVPYNTIIYTYKSIYMRYKINCFRVKLNYVVCYKTIVTFMVSKKRKDLNDSVLHFIKETLLNKCNLGEH